MNNVLKGFLLVGACVVCLVTLSHLATTIGPNREADAFQETLNLVEKDAEIIIFQPTVLDPMSDQDRLEWFYAQGYRLAAAMDGRGRTPAWYLERVPQEPSPAP